MLLIYRFTVALHLHLQDSSLGLASAIAGVQTQFARVSGAVLLRDGFSNNVVSAAVVALRRANPQATHQSFISQTQQCAPIPLASLLLQPYSCTLDQAHETAIADAAALHRLISTKASPVLPAHSRAALSPTLPSLGFCLPADSPMLKHSHSSFVSSSASFVLAAACEPDMHGHQESLGTHHAGTSMLHIFTLNIQPDLQSFLALQSPSLTNSTNTAESTHSHAMSGP